jgi:hypothetical protein
MRLGSIVISTIVAAAVGFAAYAYQTGKIGGKAGAKSPMAVVDTVAVKTDLLTMANAERQQFALEGKYLSFDELRKRGVPVPERRGPYVYTAEVTDQNFLIKATYQAKEGEAPQPPLTIGPDMKVNEGKTP